ncbi:DNA-binding transcriptional regulator LsrR, DeoR family [Paracoccus halophilus]|uniref:DNA-binding transcriptional regulator LsrR, DeoR family n=1 Tax=Paracoccus halophilus TaxID=376733 RepID=A0A099F0B3_9RHOB|nr:sugar-binding transcriptional regulator [Paracoccus halophilus]KGJ03904.1 DeoR faimly transcriptional regulator [Paracoccus halophilus]SFA56531.1 DNA-binding transcriptional regulator LsrR, DeoR family [Paracoccus halophilus]
MAKRAVPDPEQSLATRAAWLHYVGGMTQAAVAKRLGLPSLKAHRLIARAVADGMVKVSIDGEIVECVELEDRICAKFGLDFCEVAPDLGEGDQPLRALGMAGAGLLRRAIESREHQVIGLGHGSTLAAAVSQLPRFDAPGMRFVSLLGGLTRSYSAIPHDVMHSLAAKTGAQAHVLPVPFFANSEHDRAILLEQPGVREIFEMSNAASLKIAGIGSVGPDAQLVTSGMIEPHEIEEIRNAGAVGEVLGHFFDAGGQVLETTLSARTLAADLERTEGSHFVAIAGGPAKYDAIRAVLKSGWLSGLVTDEATARVLTAPS